MRLNTVRLKITLACGLLLVGTTVLALHRSIDSSLEAARALTETGTGGGTEAQVSALFLQQLGPTLAACTVGMVLLWLVLGRLTGPLGRSLRQVQAISRGDLSLRTHSTSGDEVGQMGRALDRMGERLERLVGEAKGLTAGLRHGDLSVRADAAPFEGCFAELCEDMNAMIDAVAEPVTETRTVLANLAAGKLDQRYSKGHVGAFGEIGEDLNQVLTVLTELTGTINRLIRAGKEGNLTERADPRTMQGSFRKLCIGVNDLMEVIVAPIQECATVLSHVAAGDLQREVVGSFEGDHARIKDSLNATVHILRRLLGETSELLDTARSGDMNQRLDTDSFQGGYRQLCEGVNAMLDSIVGPVRSASSSLSASSERMDVVARQMSDDAEVANEQTDNLATLTSQVSERVSTVSLSVSEMAAGIEEISRSMTKASGIASSAVQRAERANTVIAQLGQSSQEIDNVTKLITSIAEQTNLLALNATIEAAHAGEAGKGFAVVAGEVKELANQTAIATEDIGRRIHEIQSDTADAITAIGEISQIISEIHDIQGIVASAMVEQTATSDGVRRDLSEASDQSSNIAQGVSRVSELMMAGLERARATQQSARDLSSAADGLTKLVS